MRLRTPKLVRLAALGIAGATTIAVVAVPASASTQATIVNVVGYSVVGPAYTALEKAFQATSAGSGVTFTNTFGASGTEANNVAKGIPADVVNLSYYSDEESDATAGYIPATWENQEDTIGGVNPATQTVYKTPGIVTDSTVVFIVRKGNPLGIKQWSDLTRKGIRLVTPNPETSGSAKWDLLAAYAAWKALGHTPNQDQNYLKSVIEHIVAEPPSGSTALSTFLAGTGDVLLDYEDDALGAVAAGDAVTVVVPPQTLLIENPIALTNTGLAKPAAVAFYQYLFSSAGQTVLAKLGYRSVLTSVWNATKSSFAAFKKSTDLQTISTINSGGWPVIDPEFFGSSVTFPPNDSIHPNEGIVTYLEQFAGQDN